jgi:hypothetical protein
LRLRFDPRGDATGLEPGMMVWIVRHVQNVGAMRSADRLGLRSSSAPLEPSRRSIERSYQAPENHR